MLPNLRYHTHPFQCFVSDRMSAVLSLRGPVALSQFRLDKLMQKAQQLGLPIDVHLSTEFWYFIDSQNALQASSIDALCALLDASQTELPNPSEQKHLFLITPRLGTISAWASKATDIANNCGLNNINRIERGMAVWIEGNLTEADKKLWLNILHDRMTETILPTLQDANQLFIHPEAKTYNSIDILSGGKAQLVHANQQLGLALSPDEIDYLLENYQN